MFKLKVSSSLGEVGVQTTEYRGFTPEELAQRAVEQIISISETTDPVLRLQAEAFRNRMFHIIVAALEQAVKSDRTTLYNDFVKQGHADMAEILRRL
tara:strand:- start:609 stop:899 length:291 start_codon:yes stop_codon:yes gene_type:complete